MITIAHTWVCVVDLYGTLDCVNDYGGCGVCIIINSFLILLNQYHTHTHTHTHQRLNVIHVNNVQGFNVSTFYSSLVTSKGERFREREREREREILKIFFNFCNIFIYIYRTGIQSIWVSFRHRSRVYVRRLRFYVFRYWQRERERFWKYFQFL